MSLKESHSQPHARTSEDSATIEITPLDFNAQREAATVLKGLIGRSEKLSALTEHILRISKFDLDVLIVGPTGTGKTIAARAIHENSQRASAPFIEINSAAFQDALVEANLFGHEKGAFTGANEQKKGLFEAAERGTIFFDEIGDMPLALQTKLLKVLESKTITRVGGSRPIRCDVRLIYATWQNLPQKVKEGTFREDLYNRINVLRVAVPTLNDRRSDIPEIFYHYLNKHQASTDRASAYVIEESALQLLVERDWPGNVRELEHVVSRLVVAAYNKPAITVEDVLEATSYTVGILPIGTRESDTKTINVPPFRIGESLPVYLSKVVLYIYNTLFAQTNSHSRVTAILNTERVALYQLLNRHRKRLEQANQPATVLSKSGSSKDKIQLVENHPAERSA